MPIVPVTNTNLHARECSSFIAEYPRTLASRTSLLDIAQAGTPDKILDLKIDRPAAVSNVLMHLEKLFPAAIPQWVQKHDLPQKYLERTSEIGNLVRQSKGLVFLPYGTAEDLSPIPKSISEVESLTGIVDVYCRIKDPSPEWRQFMFDRFREKTDLWRQTGSRSQILNMSVYAMSKLPVMEEHRDQMRDICRNQDLRSAVFLMDLDDDIPARERIDRFMLGVHGTLPDPVDQSMFAGWLSSLSSEDKHIFIGGYEHLIDKMDVSLAGQLLRYARYDRSVEEWLELADTAGKKQLGFWTQGYKPVYEHEKEHMLTIPQHIVEIEKSLDTGSAFKVNMLFKAFLQVSQQNQCMHDPSFEKSMVFAMTTSIALEVINNSFSDLDAIVEMADAGMKKAALTALVFSSVMSDDKEFTKNIEKAIFTVTGKPWPGVIPWSVKKKNDPVDRILKISGMEALGSSLRMLKSMEVSTKSLPRVISNILHNKAMDQTDVKIVQDDLDVSPI